MANNMLLVIDGQGGGIGRSLIECLRKMDADVYIRALGCNAIATSAMLKGGADDGATGENSILVCAPAAKVIAGPMGIVLANSMLGELTPAMAKAVADSSARKVLIPVQKCNTSIAGVGDAPMGALIENAADIICNYMK